jgi:hypothetical protein
MDTAKLGLFSQSISQIANFNPHQSKVLPALADIVASFSIKDVRAAESSGIDLLLSLK